MSDSLWPHGLQHARPPCPSPTPGVYSNSCPLSQWCQPTISSSIVPFSHLQSFPASGSFPMSVLRIRWPKYWSVSFSISPSNEYSGLISLILPQILNMWCMLLTFKINTARLWSTHHEDEVIRNSCNTRLCKPSTKRSKSLGGTTFVLAKVRIRDKDLLNYVKVLAHEEPCS